MLQLKASRLQDSLSREELLVGTRIQREKSDAEQVP